MPFGLTNAPATFCNLMNDVLFDYFDAFVDGQRQSVGYYGVVSPYQSDGVAVLPWLCQLLQKMAFEGLKEAIFTELVLRLPDLDLPFEVQTDASDRTLGGVLVQEGHHVAFETFYSGHDNMTNTFFKTRRSRVSAGAMAGVLGRLQI
ncbi:hypothetical protein AAG906_013517 [Vitis piasezkii]